ncbi:hypothetical protein BDV25DRAFT_140824 [Aspergillus avenaceus]|uniref:BTB domain-containing protein n=1 Tax=Aspergillus avenaceus TaxID=36643 RepID=A0A5N6TT20_ASPAV|nr:hypothetical protein BDV25DRAFT_140824 [Aspergillus avenaceus]
MNPESLFGTGFSLQTPDPHEKQANNGPLKGTEPHIKALLKTGDVIIEYAPLGSNTSVSRESTSHRWQVLSDDLMNHSPYFRVLFDPNKFSEGKDFVQQKEKWGQRAVNGAEGPLSDDHIAHLPTIRLPVEHLPPDIGAETTELFLKILSFNSLGEEEQAKFDTELKIQPTSLITRLIELADAFNSLRVVREALNRSSYSFGKGRISLVKFNPSILRLSEDRIRQTIFIAKFLEQFTIFQIWTHALILLGSKSWVNGVEAPTSVATRWRYLSDGLEEEMYYRRQSILNTITDLQAYFLRAFGALEEQEAPKTASTSLTATAVQMRQYQCRCGFGNSSSCDAFHLGQMTRFFTLRTKTVFLGSTLIDPDFGLDSEDEETSDPPPPPPRDILTILSALKQCPDYQIDTNHNGCGVRRRFLPPLDCIEKFLGDARGLVGIELQDWDEKKWPHASSSWANRSLRRALALDVHLSRISSVARMSSGLSRPSSQEENARLLFTAKRRNWEA